MIPENENRQIVEVAIEPPTEGKKVQLAQAINSVQGGTTIKLLEGKYPIEEPILINKSVKLLGAGLDKTFITGSDLFFLLKATGESEVSLEGISFIAEGENSATAVMIECKSVNATGCRFSGGRGERDKKFGSGLYVGENCEVEISQSRFEENQESGLWIDGEANGSVLQCEFRRNDSGLAVTGNASINSQENYFVTNKVGIAYDHTSTGRIIDNTFEENRAAALMKGKSSPTFLKNTLHRNDMGIALAENCDVCVDENEISDGQYAIKNIHNSKAIIKNNQIHDNETGVWCVNKSTAEILNNDITHHSSIAISTDDQAITHIVHNNLNENGAAIQIQGSSKSTIENNQVVGNSLFGILAKSSSKGSIRRNVVKKNVHWNVKIKDDADFEFDDYKEEVSPAKPIIFTLGKDVVNVSAPKENERVYFRDLLKRAKPEQEILLESGFYAISEPIQINKPIKLVAKIPGEVQITGEDIPNLLTYSSRGKLVLQGIRFSLDSPNQANVIIIKSGSFEINECNIEGGKDEEQSKRDFGAGLILLNDSISSISNSAFTRNFLGISVQGKACIDLKSSKFYENGYGIVFRDKSTGTLSDNEYYKNMSYGLMAYDKSGVTILGDKCHNNQAGFGFINSSKATAENLESYENEYHGFFIDNTADCTLRKSRSYSNKMSGIAIYGDSHTLIEDNVVFENSHGGFEISENATSTIKNNQIYDNENMGIYLGNTASALIEMNVITGNMSGIRISENATATIMGNNIYKNSGEAIEDSSASESTIGENEIYENGEENNDDDSGEMNLGDLFAQMLGSENLSNDPNIGLIPLGGDLLGGIVDKNDDQGAESIQEEAAEDQSELTENSSRPTGIFSTLLVLPSPEYHKKETNNQAALTFEESIARRLQEEMSVPITLTMIPACKKAIELANLAKEEEWVELPDNVTWLMQPSLKSFNSCPAYEIIRWCGLGSFVYYYDEDILEKHLLETNEPDIAKALVPFCKQALDLVNAGDFDTEVELPQGMSWTDQETSEIHNSMDSGNVIHACELYEFVFIEVMKKKAREQGKEVPF